MASEGIHLTTLDAAPGETPLTGDHQNIGRPLACALVFLGPSAALLYGAINADLPTCLVFWGGLALGSFHSRLLFLLLAIRGPGHGPASWRLGPWMMIW